MCHWPNKIVAHYRDTTAPSSSLVNFWFCMHASLKRLFGVQLSRGSLVATRNAAENLQDMATTPSSKVDARDLRAHPERRPPLVASYADWPPNAPLFTTYAEQQNGGTDLQVHIDLRGANAPVDDDKSAIQSAIQSAILTPEPEAMSARLAGWQDARVAEAEHVHRAEVDALKGLLVEAQAAVETAQYARRDEVQAARAEAKAEAMAEAERVHRAETGVINARLAEAQSKQRDEAQAAGREAEEAKRQVEKEQARAAKAEAKLAEAASSRSALTSTDDGADGLLLMLRAEVGKLHAAMSDGEASCSRRLLAKEAEVEEFRAQVESQCVKREAHHRQQLSEASLAAQAQADHHRSELIRARCACKCAHTHVYACHHMHVHVHHRSELIRARWS